MVAFIVLLPLATFGAQTMFTETSVQRAYQSQQKEIETQITSNMKAMVLLSTKGRGCSWYPEVGKATSAEREACKKWVALEEQNNQLNEDKRILDVAYKLLVGSFKAEEKANLEETEKTKAAQQKKLDAIQKNGFYIECNVDGSSCVRWVSGSCYQERNKNGTYSSLRQCGG